ncbi:acyl-CoA-like ligand-binding transcription factor [Gordonia sp. NPDC003429]
MAHDAGGRPATTSAHQLAAQAQRLFLENGFDQTSVEDIATAGGVSRRTFFRYFRTKADVIWVESDAEHAHFERLLATAEPGMDPWDAVAQAYIGSIDHGRAEDEWARHRAQLILNEPAVQSQAWAVYRRWRHTVAGFVADRSGSTARARLPLATGHCANAAVVAAHEHWLNHPDLALDECMRTMFELMRPREPE